MLLFWVKLCSPKRYAKILIYGTCKYDLDWKWEVCRYKVKIKSWIIIQYKWSPYKGK